VTRPAGQEISKVLQLGMAIQLPTAFEMWLTLTTANGANYPQGPVRQAGAPNNGINREGRFYDHRHGRVTVPLVSRMARFSQFYHTGLIRDTAYSSDVYVLGNSQIANTTIYRTPRALTSVLNCRVTVSLLRLGTCPHPYSFSYSLHTYPLLFPFASARARL